MSGVGAFPLGVGPYGIGTPDAAPVNAGTALTDAFGAVQGSRFINPRTRQYEFDANGRIKGMPGVANLVEMAFLTVDGSSAVNGLGIAPASGVIGANFIQRRTQQIQDALAQLVKAKLIEVVSVSVDATSRPIQSVVRWRDLTTQTEQESRV